MWPSLTLLAVHLLGVAGVSCTYSRGLHPIFSEGLGDTMVRWHSLYINTVYMVHIQTAVEED